MATLKGGTKLEAALKEISKKVTQKAVLQVGVLEGATDTEGDPIYPRAVANEFGAPSKGIPPRPFFRNGIAKYGEEWGAKLGHFLKHNDFDATKSLNDLGEIMKEDIQRSIRDTNSPPLNPATIKRKGFDKPLIEHGDLLNSIDHRVKDDE